MILKCRVCGGDIELSADEYCEKGPDMDPKERTIAIAIVMLIITAYALNLLL